MATEKKSLTIPQPVIQAMQCRNSNLSAAISTSLIRYMRALRDARRQLEHMFDDSERGLLLDALNGTAFVDHTSIRLMAYGIEDAIKLDRLDAKWDVDGDELLKKMWTLSQFDLLAIVDAVEVWWQRVSAGETPQPAELFAYHPDDDQLKSLP